MTKTVEVPVVWFQGAACTGCVVSMLNTFSSSKQAELA